MHTILETSDDKNMIVNRHDLFSGGTGMFLKVQI